ncbi:MAG: response regulator [Chloroflexi bacterium]|nr:response regulator [Chloroflexota bacterium]
MAGRDLVKWETGKGKSTRDIGVGLSVLILDDEPNILVTTERLLSKKGFKVQTCQRPSLAVDILRRQRFSILLVDVVMPEMDGFQVAEAAMQLDPKLTIVLTTGQATLDRAVKATRSGLHGFLLKPYSADELIKALQEALERNGAIQEHFELEALKPLIETSTSILSEVDPEILSERIVRVAWRETQADRVCLMLVDENGRGLTVQSCVGPLDQFARTVLAPLENRIAKRVLETNKPFVWTSGTADDTAADEIVGEEDIAAVLCLPLEAKERTIGVLSLAKFGGAAPFTRSQMELGFILGGQAAVAIEKARLYDELRSEKARAEALMVQATMAQEEERRRVSSEVHDTVAQWLVAAQSHVEICRACIEEADLEDAFNELDQLQGTLRQSAHELRRILMDLRPVDLQVGLAVALKHLAGKFEDDTGIAAHYHLSGTYLRLPEEKETLIYRIVQEALNNVRKHAAASEVKIYAEFNAQVTRVEIADDGIGFSCAQESPRSREKGHLGLSVMRQRAEMLRGDLSVSSELGVGTRVSLLVPSSIRQRRLGGGSADGTFRNS